LKKYKETLREDPDPYDDNEIKQDMHRLELRVRDCESKLTPPNAIPLGLCSGNHQYDRRHANGKIQRSDIEQAPTVVVDTNKDGMIDEAEMQKLLQKLRLELEDRFTGITNEEGFLKEEINALRVQISEMTV